MNKVMAVILNYNSYDDTMKCFDYLKKQEGVDLKACIVDNKSTENRQDDLRQLADQDTFVIINEDNKGFSAGNNLGLKKAAEENCNYSLIINPDVEIRDKDYLKKLSNLMDEDKTIAVAGTDIVKADGKHQNPLREPYFLEEVFWRMAIAKNKLSKKIPYVKNYSKSGVCQKLSGCCFMVDMNFMKDVGFLDEGVFLYSEESILAAQARDKGLIEYYCADLSVNHLHKDSEGADKEKLMRYSVESKKYFIEKYGCYGKRRDNMVKKVLNRRLRKR